MREAISDFTQSEKPRTRSAPWQGGGWCRERMFLLREERGLRTRTADLALTALEDER
jgi:hypothetical protein